MKDAILDSINHLLNKLAKSVKQNNKSKGLGGIIGRLAWLEYNYRDRLLEMSGLVVK